MMDACENIRVGTGLFAKVYHVVVKWYGSEPPEAFDDAIYAWRTGYFEGKSVFQEADPGKPIVRAPDLSSEGGGDDEETQANTSGTESNADQIDPAKSDLRIDLSRLNAVR